MQFFIVQILTKLIRLGHALGKVKRASVLRSVDVLHLIIAPLVADVLYFVFAILQLKLSVSAIFLSTTNYGNGETENAC